MKCAGESYARLLGATCRTLRHISISYIYESRTLALNLSSDGFHGVHEQGDAILNEWLRSRIVDSRCKLLLDADFLVTCPDITSRIKTLKLLNAWNPHGLDRAGLPDGSSEQVTFFSPIWEAFSKVLACTCNVVSLDLTSVVITTGMLAALNSISSLRNLNICGCSCPALLFSPGGILLRSVRNMAVNLGLDQPVALDMDFDSLPVLNLTPNVRMVVLSGTDKRDLHLETLDRGTGIPFISAGRMIMDHSSSSTIPWVRSRILEAAERSSGLRLTHFRFHSMFGLSMEDMLVLVDGLRMAPLQILSLEGLSRVDAELFQLLAGAFPNLRALTLYYRDSDRQLENKAVTWPERTWEYARYLSASRHLEHFGWNFSISPDFAGTTWDITYMEEGYNENTWLPEDDMYFFDWSCLARLFAAHCQSLKSLVFFSGRRIIPAACFDISRGARGELDIKRHSLLSQIDRMGNLIRRHDWASPQYVLNLELNPWVYGDDEED